MKCRNCEITYDDRLDVCPLCDTPSTKNEAADVPRENARPHEHRCSNCDHVFFGKDLHECPKCHSFLREPVAMETRELFTRDKEYITKEQRDRIKQAEEDKIKKIEEQNKVLAEKREKLHGNYRIFCRAINILMLPVLYKLLWLMYEGEIIAVVISMFAFAPIFYGLSLCFGLDIIDRIYKDRKTQQRYTIMR